jgi:hypothetical protein
MTMAEFQPGYDIGSRVLEIWVLFLALLLILGLLSLSKPQFPSLEVDDSNIHLP